MFTTQVQCFTYFDITCTGVRSHYKPSLMPFQDKTGKTIVSLDDWNKARNQQRNWETLNQLIALRTLPENITAPVLHIDGETATWSFTFDIPHANVVDELLTDCHGVPMIIGLNETTKSQAWLDTLSSVTNCWIKINSTGE